MFNAVRVSLEGKVSGARESQLLHAETLKGLVRGAGRELAGARKKGDSRRVHQKTRRLDNLRYRLARVEADMAAGLVRLCFGGASRKEARKSVVVTNKYHFYNGIGQRLQRHRHMHEWLVTRTEVT